MEKQINIIINFPDDKSLTSYCVATGWSVESGKTKKDWIKEEMVKRIKATIESYELNKLDSTVQTQRKEIIETTNKLLIT